MIALRMRIGDYRGLNTVKTRLIHFLKKRPRLIIAGACLSAVVFLALGGLLLSSDTVMYELKSAIVWFWEALKVTSPWYYYAALAILPALGAPISPLILLAPALHGLPIAIGGVAVALFFNISLGYWLTIGIARPLACRIIEFFGYKIPMIRPENERRLIILFRVTPGLPFCVQNVMLGLAGVSYLPYLAISWGIIFVTALGFLTLGESLTQGSGGLVFLAVSLIIVFAVLIKMLRKRTAQSGEDLDSMIQQDNP